MQFNVKCITQPGVGDEDLAGTLEGNFRIYDVAIQADTQLDFTETTKTGKLTASKFIDDIEYVYSGGDGLPDNGWNSSAAITTIIAAHRDILHRNTSYTNSIHQQTGVLLIVLKIGRSDTGVMSLKI